MPEWQPPALVVLVGASVEATLAARDLRGDGVPVLHLAEDITREDAMRYARSVEAAWVCFPEGENLDLIPVDTEPGAANGSRRVAKAEAARVVLG
jgi:hypothetical protein